MVVELCCDHCSSTIEKYKSQIKENNFCNRDCLSEWQSDNVSGEKHPRYNKVEVSCDNCGETFKRKPSLVEKSEKSFCDMECRNESYNKNEWDFGPEEKHLDIECDNCGEKFEKYPSRIERSEYDFCSKECHYDFIPKNGLRSKEKNPFWNGGETCYYGSNWQEQREQRLSKDDYKCVRCGMHESDSKDMYNCSLNIHHIVPIKSFNGDYKSANNIDNLVTLCNSCHVTMEVLSSVEQKEILFGGKE